MVSGVVASSYHQRKRHSNGVGEFLSLQVWPLAGLPLAPACAPEPVVCGWQNAVQTTLFWSVVDA